MSIPSDFPAKDITKTREEDAKRYGAWARKNVEKHPVFSSMTWGAVDALLNREADSSMRIVTDASDQNRRAYLTGWCSVHGF